MRGGIAAPHNALLPHLYLCTTMYYKLSVLLIFASLAVATRAQQPTSSPNNPVDSSKKSIPAIAKGMAGGASITIEYHSPRVRGRNIWGGVVPYNEVWVSGAHMATKITFSQPTSMGNKTVPAGTYAFFTIPGTDNWTVILNHNYNQHLADNYDATLDILRLQVTPQYNQPFLERLEYFILPNKLVLGWEQLRIEVPFQTVNL